MQDLYPIIRRKRRPLVAVDAPPVVVGSVEPVNVVASPARTAADANPAADASTPSVPQEEAD